MFREEKARNCVERKELLGTGSFGSVYRGDWLQAIDGKRKEVAVKIVPYSGNDVDQLGRELYFLKRFNSPFTVGYFDSFVSHSELWILMEICDSGSLLDIYRSSEKSLSEAELRASMACSALGLLHVHEQQAIHRDIKAGNILLCSSGKVMLSDFGVSTKLTDTLQRRNTVIGTPYWMAPEILLESSYTENVDVWSLGVTVLEIAEKKPPHNGVKPISAMFLITYKPAPTLAEPSKWSTEMQSFLTRCLVKDPNLRASSKEIAEHSWIKKEVAILRQCQANNQNCSLPVLIDLAKRNIETIRQNRLKIIEASMDDDNYGDSVEMVDEDMCTETWDDKRNPRPRGGSVERNDFVKRAWQTKHFDVSHAKGSPLEESMRLKTEGVGNGVSKVTEIVKELNSPRIVYTNEANNLKTAGTNDTFVYKRPTVNIGGNDAMIQSPSGKTPVKKNSIVIMSSSRSPITQQQYQSQQQQQAKGRGNYSNNNSNHSKANDDGDEDTVELNNAHTHAVRTAISQMNNNDNMNGEEDSGTLRLGQFESAVATALAASNNNITKTNNKNSSVTASNKTAAAMQPDADTVFLVRQLDQLSAYDSARTNTSDAEDTSASGRRSSTSSNGDGISGGSGRPVNRIGRSSTVSSSSSNHNTLKPTQGGYGGGNNHTRTTSPAKPRRKSFVIEIPDKFTGVVERLTHILDRMDDFTGMNSPRYATSAVVSSSGGGVQRREFKEVPLPSPPQKNEFKASPKTTTNTNITVSGGDGNGAKVSGGLRNSIGTPSTPTAAAKALPNNNTTTSSAAAATAKSSSSSSANNAAASSKASSTTASVASTAKATSVTTTSAKMVGVPVTATSANSVTSSTATALSSSADAKTKSIAVTSPSASKSVVPTPPLKSTATANTATTIKSTATVSPLRSAANSVSAAASTFFKSSSSSSTDQPKTASTTATTFSSSSFSGSSGGNTGTMTFSGFLDGRRRTSSAALPLHSSSNSGTANGVNNTTERVRAVSSATAPLPSERRYSTTAVPLSTTTAGITSSTNTAALLTSTSNKAIPSSTAITKPSQVLLRTTPKPPSY